MVSLSSCALCQAPEEGTQHLFVECAVAQRVWVLFFKWIGILIVQHKDLRCYLNPK